MREGRFYLICRAYTPLYTFTYVLDLLVMDLGFIVLVMDLGSVN
nr:MAG TPA: hypothetical protein [Microviridae sp.]